jgi:ribonuclease T2
MIEYQKLEVKATSKWKTLLHSFVLIAMTFWAVFLIAVKHGKIGNTKTDFDVLIFSQSWPNTVCSQWMDRNKINTCTFPKLKESWTIHGVWPTKFHTKGPQFCDRTKPFDFEKLTSIEDEMMEKWTNVEKNTPLDQLWEHEWEKHGTCAAQHIPAMDTELKYFQKGLDFLDTYSVTKLLNATNIKPGIDASYKLEEIHAALKTSLNKSFAIICEKDKKTRQNFIKEIRICFDKKLTLQSCNGIVNDDEDPDDEIITNCKKGQKIVYPSTAYLWRQKFNRKTENEKFSYGDWLDYVISAVSGGK